ncbi:MAG: biotin/lipoyl-containing protein [Pseudomonadota bacterium]
MPEDAAVARKIALKSPGDGFDYPVFVERLLVSEGERVAAGRPFAIVVSARERRRVLAAPMDGHIVEIRHSYGATLAKQDVLAVLETFAPIPRATPKPQPQPQPKPKPADRRPPPQRSPQRPHQRPRQQPPAREVRPAPPSEPPKPAAATLRSERDILRVASPSLTEATAGALERSGGFAGILLFAILFLPLAFLLAAHAGYAAPEYQRLILLAPIALTVGTLMALTVLFHTRTRLGRRIGETMLGLGMGAVLVVVMHGLFYLASTPGVLEIREQFEWPILTDFFARQFGAS